MSTVIGNRWPGVLYSKCAPFVMSFRLLPYASQYHTGLILGLRRANERRCYFVRTSFIGWAQTENHPCLHYFVSPYFNFPKGSDLLQSTLVLSFCIDVVLTLYILFNTVLHQVEEIYYIVAANVMKCPIYGSLHTECHCISTNAPSGATGRKHRYCG